jgi:DnaK suppressor protein
MAATSTITSRGPSREIDDEVLARLRTALVADRAPQAALVRANEITAQTLTGQRDVDSILEREIAEASAARARDAIDDIDAALAKMAGGTYGTCESCRSPIPVERLEAIPHARTCVACPT